MTVEELTAQLLQIKDEIAAREKLQRNLKRVRADLEAERARLQTLNESSLKESRDVEQLEGLSLTGLFYQILGSKEEQLDQARREELAARLKLSQCTHAVAALTREFSELTRRMAEVKDLDAKYEAVLKEKEKLLLGDGATDARLLIALAEKTGSLQVSQKELGEAIMAGEAVRLGLERVILSLNSARSWGTFDLIGGGLIATAIKHRRIDDARGQVQEVQVLALSFQRELADVRLDVDLPIQFDSFTKFADYFFDNLITDWIVNSRIDDSRNSTKTASAKVEQILEQLQKRLADGQRQIAAAAESRRTIIERA